MCRVPSTPAPTRSRRRSHGNHGSSERMRRAEATGTTTRPPLHVSAETMFLMVDLHGSQYNIQCEDADSVGQFKRKVAERVAGTEAAVSSADILGLVFEGERLDDDARTLAEYGLRTDGARVYLCLRQRAQTGAWVRAEHAHRAARHGGMRA
eukprot:SAG22_NODE_1029_length_5939_cov_46.559589_4_plen_152_part_00